MTEIDCNEENERARASLIPGTTWYSLLSKKGLCGYCGSQDHKLSKCKKPGSFEFPFSEIRTFKGR